MLGALTQKSGYNTFTVKQAQKRFGVKNVSARIEELRKEGHCIYTNTKNLKLLVIEINMKLTELLKFWKSI